MIEWVAEALASCVEQVRVVVRLGARPPIELPSVEDRLDVRAPLAGLHAALSACEASGVLVVPCDLPEIEPRLLLALLALAPEADPCDAVVPFRDGTPEPLLAVYRPSALGTIERRAGGGDLSLRGLLGDLHVRRVPIEVLRPFDPDLRSFVNVNCPEDLSTLRARG